MSFPFPDHADVITHHFTLPDGPIVKNWENKPIKITDVVVSEFPNGEETQIAMTGWLVTAAGERDKRYSYRVSAHSIETQAAAQLAWAQRTHQATPIS